MDMNYEINLCLNKVTESEKYDDIVQTQMQNISKVCYIMSKFAYNWWGLWYKEIQWVDFIESLRNYSVTLVTWFILGVFRNQI